ncbi:MAG: pyridoxal-dependent decarboxylase [Monoraphidium minutum]|nr:MAG: pyridoxal-dependent decarboxylase [Monoraphidium minutum]
MASIDVLSPCSMGAAASLDVAALNSLCSGSLDELIAPQQAPARGGAPASPLSPSRAAAAPRGAASAEEGASADPVRAAKVQAATELVKMSWQYKATGSVAAAGVLADLGARRIPHGGPAGMKRVAASLIKAHGLDDTTYVYDLGNTVRLFRAWRAAMPRVAPFYAVKCNPEPALLRLLAALGAGFDCASKAELEAVLALGVPPERVIFAHPCKRPADLRFAAGAGVQLTTFDTEGELGKVAAAYPGVGLVLRVRCDDPDARVPLGLKYGADPSEAPRLLAAAKDLGLRVVGVSFHVGSACKNLAAFDAAIATAAAIFEQGAALGHAMSLLDVGGGFSGRFDAGGHVVFGDIARAVSAALAAHFPPDAGVRVIAEPGRYFAEASAALAVPVYGTRDRPAAGGGVHKDYWLTDGLYGSFNCILYDGQKPQPHVLRSPLLPSLAADAEAPRFPSTLWGPTCDSADYIYKGLPLPELRTGDWLLFPGAGAYTVAGACDFNGIAMTEPTRFCVFSECAADDAADAGDAEPAAIEGCEAPGSGA